MVVIGLNDPQYPPLFNNPNNRNPTHVNPTHVRPNRRFNKMTKEQFIKWLDDVDSNKDGVISRQELYDALKVLGFHFKTWRAWRAMKKIDMNHNGVIDPGLEMKKLIEYAGKLGIIITD
ncbi:hypothetical protein LUZ60_002724 [Juncus effusus]|nr:hypothetical protein LUZ60_002724 [Juncus effusus]